MSQAEYYTRWKADQAVTLDAMKATVAKEEGIARAEAGVPDWWKTDAYHAVVAVAREHQFFTADEVWVKLGEVPDGINPSALGPVIRSVEQAGFIRSTGRFKQAQIARRHRQLMIWERTERMACDRTGR